MRYILIGDQYINLRLPMINIRGNYNIIQMNALFSISYNDLLYYFMYFYYIIQGTLSLSILCASFAQYYNIIHAFCLFCYIIHFQIDTPAIFIFHSTCGTP